MAQTSAATTDHTGFTRTTVTAGVAWCQCSTTTGGATAGFATDFATDFAVYFAAFFLAAFGVAEAVYALEGEIISSWAIGSYEAGWRTFIEFFETSAAN